MNKLDKSIDSKRRRLNFLKGVFGFVKNSQTLSGMQRLPAHNFWGIGPLRGRTFRQHHITPARWRRRGQKALYLKGVWAIEGDVGQAQQQFHPFCGRVKFTQKAERNTRLRNRIIVALIRIRCCLGEGGREVKATPSSRDPCGGHVSFPNRDRTVS